MKKEKIKSILYVSLNILLFNIGIAQNNGTDSLLQVIKVKTDSNKVLALIELALLQDMEHSKLGLKYLGEAVDYANKISYTNGLLDATLQLGKLSFSTQQDSLAWKYYTEVERLALQFSNRFYFGKAKIYKGRLLEKQGNHSESKKLLLEAIKIFQEVKSYSWIANTYRSLGRTIILPKNGTTG